LPVVENNLVGPKKKKKRRSYVENRNRKHIKGNGLEIIIE